MSSLAQIPTLDRLSMEVAGEKGRLARPYPLRFSPRGIGDGGSFNVSKWQQGSQAGHLPGNNVHDLHKLL
jgi:hypothetical protein